MSPVEQVKAILTFWFGEPGSDDASYQKRRQLWFSKKPEFDQEVRARFLSDYQQAAAGGFGEWQQSPQGCLALILLLDQFPRNLFRRSPQAFATDPQALAVAKEAIAHSFDMQLEPIQRIFVYLPFEHSENLNHQIQSVNLFRQLHAQHPEFEDVLDYAIRHLKVIERFGRFPHRNLILGREHLPAEAEFLTQPGSSF